MICSERFLADRKRALVHRLRFRVIATAIIKPGKIAERVCDLRMVRSQSFLAKFQDALAQWFRFGQISLVLIEKREIGRARDGVRVLRAELLFPNLYRALVERLGFHIVGVLAISLGQIIEDDRGIGMILAERFFSDLQCAFIKCRRFGMIARSGIQRCEIVQTVGGFGMVRPVFFFAILQHFFSDRHCFPKFPRVSQLIDLLNLPTDVRRVLCDGEIQTECQREKPGGVADRTMEFMASFPSFCREPVHGRERGHNAASLQVNFARKYGSARALRWNSIVPRRAFYYR